jgi:hypothetical protein
MTGLFPAIHVFTDRNAAKTWMPASNGDARA